MNKFKLSIIPKELEWKNQPLDWNVEADDRLLIVAGNKTDWFIDPAGNGYTPDNAPCALFVPSDENFILSAKVTVDFDSDFDAGVFQLRVSKDIWAKLCFEYSPQHQPMIVSVVTRHISDDCNSVIIGGNEVYLRLAVKPGLIAFHYSVDGVYWHLVRYFTLGNIEHLSVGFSSQSPTGEKCKTIFSEIQYRAGVLKEYRNGE